MPVQDCEEFRELGRLIELLHVDCSAVPGLFREPIHETNQSLVLTLLDPLFHLEEASASPGGLVLGEGAVEARNSLLCLRIIMGSQTANTESLEIFHTSERRNQRDLIATSPNVGNRH